MKPKPFTSFKTCLPDEGQIVDVLFSGKIRECTFLGRENDHDIMLDVHQDPRGKITVYDGLASWRVKIS